MRILANGYLPASWPVDGRAVCTASQAQVNQAVASDDAGGAFIAWNDLRNGVQNDIYVQHVLADGAIDPLWPANGLGVCTASGNQALPAIIPDGSGGAVLAWRDGRNLPTNGEDIYAQRVSAGGAFAWTTNGVAVCDTTGLQESPVLVGDNTGGALIAWTDLRGATGRDIFAQHVTGAGARDPVWPKQGAALSAAVGDQEESAIIPDASSGAIVAWQDFRNGNDYDVYVQRVTVGGSVLWQTDGSPASTSTGYSLAVRAVPDDAGGIVLSWHDLFGGNIYAQRLASDGSVAPGWPMDGIAVCAAAGVQANPSIVADAAGGAIIAWEDGRLGSGNSDVFAQRVTAEGEAGPTTSVPWAGFLQVPHLSAAPNPASSSTEIRLVLSAESVVTVAVFDLAGRLVAPLLSAVQLPAGTHKLQWQATQHHRHGMEPGVYFVEASLQGATLATRLVLVR